MTHHSTAPPNFVCNDEIITFVDVISAHYNIIVHAREQRAVVQSKLRFLGRRGAGHPVFMLGHTPQKVKLDQNSCSASMALTPDCPGSTYRPGRGFERIAIWKLDALICDRKRHQLDCEHELHQAAFDGKQQNLPRGAFVAAADGVYLRTSMCDYDSQTAPAWFLDSYLPCNLEYDSYPIYIDLHIEGTQTPHSIVTNGVVTQLSEYHWKIKYPAWFSCSSVWLDVLPTNAFVRLEPAIFKAPDQSVRAIVIYRRANQRVALQPYLEEACKSLTRLWNDFGAFPTDNIVIAALPGQYGSMEYSGATASRLGDLSHELNHSYFARCMRPANGNAGWIDEAIAMWWEHPGNPVPDCSTCESMGIGSPYRRSTRELDALNGVKLLRYFQGQLSQRGTSLTAVLRGMFHQYRGRAITSQTLRQVLIAHGLPRPSVTAIFKEFVVRDHAEA